MGCFHSKESVLDDNKLTDRKEAPTKQYHKPKWRSQEQLTPARLQRMREEFWDTQPHYGGSKEIWDAIKAAVESPDMDTTRLLIDAAGVIVAKSNMTVMYDERGAKYELPKYVLTAPSNLVQEPQEQTSQLVEESQQQQQQQQQHVQLPETATTAV